MSILQILSQTKLLMVAGNYSFNDFHAFFSPLLVFIDQELVNSHLFHRFWEQMNIGQAQREQRGDDEEG